MPQRRSEKSDGTAVLLGEVQAALWLSESLMLALLEANLLDSDTILEAIDIVIAAKKTKTGEDPEQIRAAVTHLASISASIAAAKMTANTGEVKRTRRTRQKPRAAQSGSIGSSQQHHSLPATGGKRATPPRRADSRDRR